MRSFFWSVLVPLAIVAALYPVFAGAQPLDYAPSWAVEKNPQWSRIQPPPTTTVIVIQQPVTVPIVPLSYCASLSGYVTPCWTQPYGAVPFYVEPPNPWLLNSPHRLRKTR